MLMPSTRMCRRKNLKTTKHKAAKTVARASVTLGLRPITTMRSHRGTCDRPRPFSCSGGFCAGISWSLGAICQSCNLDLAHRLVQSGVKLVHRRLGLVAHVRDAERLAFDFSVTAVNQKALVLHQLLQLRHVRHAATGLRAIVDAGERDGFKTLVREQRESMFRRPGARHFGQLFVARETVFQTLGKKVFEL